MIKFLVIVGCAFISKAKTEINYPLLLNDSIISSINCNFFLDREIELFGMISGFLQSKNVLNCRFTIPDIDKKDSLHTIYNNPSAYADVWVDLYRKEIKYENYSNNLINHAHDNKILSGDNPYDLLSTAYLIPFIKEAFIVSGNDNFSHNSTYFGLDENGNLQYNNLDQFAYTIGTYNKRIPNPVDGYSEGTECFKSTINDFPVGSIFLVDSTNIPYGTYICSGQTIPIISDPNSLFYNVKLANLINNTNKLNEETNNSIICRNVYSTKSWY